MEWAVVVSNRENQHIQPQVIRTCLEQTHFPWVGPMEVEPHIAVKPPSPILIPMVQIQLLMEDPPVNTTVSVNLITSLLFSLIL